jgi:prophage regulatory protein
MLLRFKQLRGAGVPFCRMHVDRLEKRGDFPKRVQIGENSVAWVQEEIRAWVDERIADRDPNSPKVTRWARRSWNSAPPALQDRPESNGALPGASRKAAQEQA